MARLYRNPGCDLLRESERLPLFSQEPSVLSGQLPYPVDAGLFLRRSIQLPHHQRLSGLQDAGSEKEAARGIVACNLLLMIGQSDAFPLKSPGPQKRRIRLKQKLPVHNDRQNLPFAAPGKGKIHPFCFRHLGAVLHTGSHPEFRHTVSDIPYLHPRLCRLSHILHGRAAHAAGDHLGHAVRRLDFQVFACHISDFHLSHQGRHRLLGERLILCRNPVLPGLLLNRQAVHADHHAPRPVSPGKWFLIRSVHSQKGTKTQKRRPLIRLVSRIKFHNGMVLILNPKAGNTLAPIHVIAPQGNSVLPADPRQKAGKGRF